MSDPPPLLPSARPTSAIFSRGDPGEVLERAWRSVELAAGSGDAGLRMANGTTLAAAPPGSASRMPPLRQLEETGQVSLPFLASLPGFRCCDLLLDQGRDASAQGVPRERLHGSSVTPGYRRRDADLVGLPPALPSEG